MTAVTKGTGLCLVAASAVAAGALALAPGAPSTRPAAPRGPSVVRPHATAHVRAGDVHVHSATTQSSPVIGRAGPGNVDAVCQVTGDEVTHGRDRNNWWIYIDHVGWIPGIFLQGGDDDAPVPAIPEC